MNPIIGVTVKYCDDDKIGILSDQGVKGEEWQLISNGYVKAVTEAGGVPLIIPIYDNAILANEIIEKLDGIIFTGGTDISPLYYGEEIEEDVSSSFDKMDKQEVNFCKEVIKNTNLPILGICRGHQLINIIKDGSLFQDIKRSNAPEHKYYGDDVERYQLAHEVIIHEGSLLYKIIGKNKICVNSFHHQAIKKVGLGLKVSGTSLDGTIEAIEGEGNRFLLGVQWHPEMMAPSDSIKDLDSIKIFNYFIEQCKNDTRR